MANVERLPYASHSSGEGDGTPLQHSCLENPMDGGAWWAAVHGAAQSRTRLSALAAAAAAAATLAGISTDHFISVTAAL